ncbi:MAG: GNAT family N-acetyltransferase [Woeseiaceae bacterium]
MSEISSTRITFRPYCSADCDACLGIFDANCPEFFAPNEREEYQQFLELVPDGYEVCEADGRVLGAFGLFDEDQDKKTLNWILLDPRSHGLGVGSSIMERVIQLGRSTETAMISIAASQKSAPFFARFGAQTTSTTTDGWGPGMHRLDMMLPL